MNTCQDGDVIVERSKATKHEQKINNLQQKETKVFPRDLIKKGKKLELK